MSVSESTRKRDPSPMDFREAHGRLLALFPEEHQGRGIDRGDPSAGPADQPMTYGLLLSCESLRCRTVPSEEGIRRIRRAARWLLDNARLAADCKPGWGLPFAWDHRPANTPYTITTAVALEGLLDAMTLEFWSAGEADEMLGLIRQVCDRWRRELWVEGFSGGYFAYSPRDLSPPWFCINAPAMFLGVMARLRDEHAQAQSVDERRALQTHGDALARAIVAQMEPRRGAPFWDYIASPNPLNSQRPNDLVHQAYILWGVESYRDAGGRVAMPWTRAQAIESLDRFWLNGTLRFMAQDEASVPASRREERANLWGAGMMLACYARWGDRDRASLCFEAMLDSYGPFPHVRVLPRDVSDDGTFYPRDAAHVLFGLAYAAFGSPRAAGKTA